jgi:hypothetical protein
MFREEQIPEAKWKKIVDDAMWDFQDSAKKNFGGPRYNPVISVNQATPWIPSGAITLRE